MRNRTVIFIIAALLFAVIAGVLHVHADGVAHDDCPVCIAARYQAAGCPSPVNRADPFFTASLEVQSDPVYPESVTLSSSSGRAPPA
jgi:hypothetical protein